MKNYNYSNYNSKKKYNNDNNKKTTISKKVKFSRPPHKPSDVRRSGNGNNSIRGN